MRHVITIHNGVPRHPLYRMAAPVNLQIDEGQQIAIVGDNASGKSMLVGILTGRYPLLISEVNYNFLHQDRLVCENIKYLTFCDSYGEADGTYYYQQRFNSQDADMTPTVRTLLPVAKNEERKKQLFQLFGIDSLLDRHIVSLSSGELRKFQLTKTLLSDPELLIIDNPFIGLDVATRSQLKLLLENLINIYGLQVVLVLSRIGEIPDFITHVIPVENRACAPKITFQQYQSMNHPVPQKVLNTYNLRRIWSLSAMADSTTSEEIVRLDKVNITYGKKIILKELDWTVRKGEKWALSGDNGSGKSTLLSLIYADNPQSYACNISLFGKKRGSGESIWEIKKRIGYVSPEMHRAYLKQLPAIDIVASGLHDTIGLYKKTHAEEYAACEWWMATFGVLELKDRNFMQLSSGEQRMVLLTRAFVKDPDLLILDEPLHGLDETNRRLVKDIIEAFSSRPGKTLIMVSHYQEDFPAVITNSLILKKNH